MKATLYTQKGTKSGDFDLPESVFGVRWNPDLVHQVVTAMQANERKGTAHTKDRSEVAGGGRKPWKQKGTGRARHGSTRSPIWRHGGVTHGPRNEKDYSQKINVKMKAKALFAVLSEKFRQGEVIFVDSLGFDAPKAKEAKGVLSALGSIEGYASLATKRKNAALIAVADVHDAVSKSFSNMGNVKVDAVRNMNARDAMDYKYVVIAAPKESIAVLEAKLK